LAGRFLVLLASEPREALEAVGLDERLMRLVWFFTEL
jgi:hypothetical protein